MRPDATGEQGIENSEKLSAPEHQVFLPGLGVSVPKIGFLKRSFATASTCLSIVCDSSVSASDAVRQLGRLANQRVQKGNGSRQFRPTFVGVFRRPRPGEETVISEDSESCGGEEAG